MKYIYTKTEAVNEIMDMYEKHIKMNMMRKNRLKKGEISTRSLLELEARDRKDMRELIESFVMVS
jgi:hypothetical protein